MIHSLRLKLILAFLAVSLTGTCLVAGLAGRMVTVQIDRAQVARVQANFIEDILTYYQEKGSWDDINHEFYDLLGPFPPDRSAEGFNEGEQRLPPAPPLPFVLVDEAGYVVKDARFYYVGDQVSPAEVAQGTPVLLNGQLIGTVLKIDDAQARDIYTWEALSRVYLVLGFAALVATLVAVLLGIFLARNLTRPLRELTLATRAMAKGELEQQVRVRTKDELGQLAVSFNQMSADLAQANQLRRQMTADIAHDLRSPLTVIAGYVESMRDGILQPTPTMLEVIHEETQHLQHLIEDLRILSLADAGELSLHPQQISPQELLTKQASAYQHQAKQLEIALQVEASPLLPAIEVDPERMAQVLGNLISNALRYTPQGGQIILSALTRANKFLLSVQDTGSGIAPEFLPHIFKRSYRVDESRRQQDSESGLGLAIAKAIVEAHGGSISAESKVGQGTKFIIALPVTP